MSVLVRNEFAEPWVFEGSGGKRQLAPAEVALISDAEWNSIISEKRGSGGINPLDSSERVKTEFDYASVNGSYEVIYIGQASPSTADTDDRWTIKKFSYQSLGGGNKVSAVEVMDSVAWADRATLSWA
jgi:hypothetical protein